ncbi:MAG: DUF3857 domain-containing protein [Saprospiraceae bacterium]|nr:DUF3857 domain-containing protein [Saprospiraceae bacterium]
MMFPKIILINLLVTFSFLKSTGQISYFNLPDSLKLMADVVTLNNEEVVEIFNNKKITYNKNTQKMIFSPEYQIIIPYDKFTKTDKILISLKTLDGKETKVIKQKDMLDQSAVDGYTIATDQRYLYYSIVEKKLPYIVQINYRQTSNASFFIQKFYPFFGKESILKSIYTVINHDVNNTIRFTESSWGNPNTDSTALRHTYTWKLENLTSEKISKLQECNENINITPILENFQMDGVQGSISSWESFGNWIYQLNDGMDALNEKTKSEIKQIIGDESDKKVIVSKLYKYLQQNMRYISIQLGIGGFKPMPAQEVHQFKYGDCKALSNYMKAILKVAEIPSKYILIQSGDSPEKLKPEQPQNVFNHAILAVLLENDTIFLECTSQNAAAGYLGTFTGNRQALMISEKNSAIVNTIYYTPDQNTIDNDFKINIYEDRDAEIEFDQKLNGVGKEHHNYIYLAAYSEEKFKKYVLENVLTNVRNLNIMTRQHETSTFKYKFNSTKQIQKSGNRYFINLNFDQLPSSILSFVENKKKEAKTQFGYTINNIYKISIPNACHPEKMMIDFTYKSEMMNLEVKTESDKGFVSIHQNFIFKEGNYNFQTSASEKEAINILKKILSDKIVINCKS